MSVMMEGNRGTGRRGPDPASRKLEGWCFSRCWFYILYLYFQEVWALAILWPNSRQWLNSVINCFQNGQSFYTLSRLLILCLLIWLDEFIPIDILWYCIPQEMHIRGRLSELKLIFPLPSSMKENVASVPLLGHNHFVPHNLIDLGLALVNQRWSLRVPGSTSLAAYHNFLLRYLLDHILSFQIQISQVTKTEFLQRFFFFNAMMLLGNFFGSANVFFLDIYLLLLYCELYWCFLLECKLRVCLMIVVVCIYHFLHLNFYLFVFSSCILREVVKFVVYIQSCHSLLEATGCLGSCWQFLAWC